MADLEQPSALSPASAADIRALRKSSAVRRACCGSRVKTGDLNPSEERTVNGPQVFWSLVCSDRRLPRRRDAGRPHCRPEHPDDEGRLLDGPQFFIRVDLVEVLPDDPA